MTHCASYRWRNISPPAFRFCFLFLTFLVGLSAVTDVRKASPSCEPENQFGFFPCARNLRSSHPSCMSLVGFLEYASGNTITFPKYHKPDLPSCFRSAPAMPSARPIHHQAVPVLPPRVGYDRHNPPRPGEAFFLGGDERLTRKVPQGPRLLDRCPNLSLE